MIGQTISHYKITAEIGAGGMGVVYEAEDLTLKRTVALKFLPPDLTRDAAARKRFIQEAQTASAIDHNNICTIHEVGETDDGRVFIAMARYTGETLRERIARGPLQVDEALDIAGQIAAGLAKAHSQDIVHRDIKPGNIFILEDGGVKILDFGLARISGESRMTKTGTTVGTVAYMSPEQAEGRDVDARSDVWSVGAVLYEMLAGRAPFRGDAEPAIVNSILTTEPEPVTKIRREVPVGIEDVVDRALAKDPGKRYQTARDLGAALAEQSDLMKAGVKTGGSVAWKRFRKNRRAVVGVSVMAVVAIAVTAWVFFLAPRQTIDSIAVLPVEDLSPDAEEKQHIAVGMTVDLISALGQVGAFRVSGRNAVQKYAQTDMTYAEIAAELGVEALVSVTMTREGENVRVSAQLIDPVSGQQMWAADFDRRMSGILDLHREVSRRVADEVHASISSEAGEFLGSIRQIDPDAYEAWSAGNSLFSLGEYERAQEQFERVLAIDSTYAPAWSGLANTYIMRCHGWPVPEGFVEKSRAYAERALELDPIYAEGYFILAHIAWEHEWDMVTARRLLDRGLELNPSSAYGHLTNTFFCGLMRDYDESLESALRNVELSPLDFLAHWGLFLAYYRAGRYEDVLAEIDAADAVVPGFEQMRDTWRFQYFRAIGDYETMLEMSDQYEEYFRSNGIRRQWVFSRAQIHFDMGDLSKASEYYDEWRSLADSTMISPTIWAITYANEGRYEIAFEWLDKAYEQHDIQLAWNVRELQIQSSPIVGDPRFQALVQKLGIGD